MKPEYIALSKAANNVSVLLRALTGIDEEL